MHDLNAAAEIDVGSILFMRVLKVGEEYEFSTSGLALPGEYGEQLLERLYRDRQEYYCEKNMEPRSWITYFKERAHVVNAIVMELGFPVPATAVRPAAGRLSAATFWRLMTGRVSWKT